MKIFNSINCRGFYICYGYASPGEVVNHPNLAENNTQNQFYLVDGSVHMTDGTNSIDLPSKQWQDLWSYKDSRKLTYTVGNDGCAWVIILPIPNSKRFSTELVNDGVVNAQDNSFLVVTEGEGVTFNGATMKNLNYAPLDKNINVVKNGGVVTKITVV